MIVDQIQTEPRRRMNSAARRAQLLEKAKEIARTRGVPSLTLASVAAACGVSKPIAYNHFGSRENLLGELYQELGSEHDLNAQTALDALRNTTTSADQAARIIAAAFIDCILQNGALYEDIVAALHASPDGRQINDRLKDGIVESYAATLIELGEDAPQANLLAQALIGAGEKLADAVAKRQTSRESAIEILSRLARRQ